MYNPQAKAAANFFEEYPILNDYLQLQEFITDFHEPANEFFCDMRLQGMTVMEAQHLTTQLYVIEPLTAILGNDIGYLLNGE